MTLKYKMVYWTNYFGHWNVPVIILSFKTFFSGDEIIGATIHFDKLKKNEVLRVLKLIEPYDENMKVLTKQDLKAGMNSWTLNNHIASPKEVSIILL